MWCSTGVLRRTWWRSELAVGAGPRQFVEESSLRGMDAGGLRNGQRATDLVHDSVTRRHVGEFRIQSDHVPG